MKVITMTLFKIYFFRIRVLKSTQEKEAGANLVLLSRSRNMIG